VEAYKTSFEADFVAGLLENDFSPLVFFICMVQLGDLTKDPEGLPVKLFFEIGV